MSHYDELDKPLLTKKEEKYQMLIEIAEEYILQERERFEAY